MVHNTVLFSDIGLLHSHVSVCDVGGIASLVAMSYRESLAWFAYHVLDQVLSCCQPPHNSKVLQGHDFRVLNFQNIKC